MNGATTPAATTSNLSGNADQFTAIDRERCPTPAEREIMDSFKPRELTEAVMSRFYMYKKHNPMAKEVRTEKYKHKVVPDKHKEQKEKDKWKEMISYLKSLS